MDNDTTIRRTFKYRLYPNKQQTQDLYRVLTACRHLYNMCLAEWQYEYETTGKTLGKYGLNDYVKHYRRVFPYGNMMSAQTGQSVTGQLDKAFKNFFRRVKQEDSKAGYPKFASWQRFNSFEFPQYPVGCKIDNGKIKLFAIGHIKVRWDNRGQPQGKIKTVRIVHEAGKWYVSFSCELPRPEPLPKTGNVVGVDVGISSLLFTSDGLSAPNPQYYREGQAKLRRLQRKLARCVKGSNNRKKVLRQVQNQHIKVSNQRKDYLHKLARYLIDCYDMVALEDLKITNMVKNKHLSKSILDSGWGAFTLMLDYKADETGRDIIYVNPAYTSKTCSSCGAIFEDLKLSDRWVTCDCGLSLDRDHNAAINILKRALGDF